MLIINGPFVFFIVNFSCFLCNTWTASNCLYQIGSNRTKLLQRRLVNVVVKHEYKITMADRYYFFLNINLTGDCTILTFFVFNFLFFFVTLRNSAVFNILATARWRHGNRRTKAGKFDCEKNNIKRLL